MSDSDWDLYAVVKSCTTSTAASDNHHRMEEDGEKHQTYYDCPSLQNDNFASPLSYGDQNTALNCGLEEVYETFSNTSTDFGSQQVIHQPQLQEPQPHSFTLSISNPQSSAIRSRRRKNQHMKMVYQMTQEELSGDTWAWRKYGQKPIKGSPYPRNYYRCSTLKGCPARKQVERNSTDSTVFIVSYTGEHAHPRPTHRSSLAGSTRNKFSAAAALNSIIKSTTTSGGESSSAAPNFSPSTSPNSALTFSSPLIQCESIHDNTTDVAETVDMDDDDHEEDYNDHYISKQEISDELHQFDSNGQFFD